MSEETWAAPTTSGRLNRKLQRQITAIGDVGRRDRQWRQDIVRKIDVHGGFSPQGTETQRCARSAPGPRHCSREVRTPGDADSPSTCRGIPKVDARVECIAVSIHEVGSEHGRTSRRGRGNDVEWVGARSKAVVENTWAAPLILAARTVNSRVRSPPSVV